MARGSETSRQCGPGPGSPPPPSLNSTTMNREGRMDKHSGHVPRAGVGGGGVGVGGAAGSMVRAPRAGGGEQTQTDSMGQACSSWVCAPQVGTQVSSRSLGTGPAWCPGAGRTEPQSKELSGASQTLPPATHLLAVPRGATEGRHTPLQGTRARSGAALLRWRWVMPL